MPSYYTYLISSLPLLSLGAKPPFSPDEFFEVCSRVIKNSDVEKIKDAVNNPEYTLYPKGPQLLREWRIFNLSLRSELAVLRAGRKKLDPSKYLSQGIYAPSSIVHAAMLSYRNQNILEAERSLDLERWRFLDEVSSGHHFDIEFLIAYALKLKILMRWDVINNADKEALFKEAINGNY
ncbi:MAG: DUF2764 family protein [Candidatus Omnitrophica bacterium]|nr:DUF2764 family protein [Candidatus Omnitrophota bacterium]